MSNEATKPSFSIEVLDFLDPEANRDKPFHPAFLIAVAKRTFELMDEETQKLFLHNLKVDHQILSVKQQWDLHLSYDEARTVLRIVHQKIDKFWPDGVKSNQQSKTISVEPITNPLPLSTPLEDLKPYLTVRAYQRLTEQRLKEHGKQIKTLADLVNLTEREIVLWRNSGRLTFNEIKAMVESCGHKLKEEEAL